MWQLNTSENVASPSFEMSFLRVHLSVQLEKSNLIRGLRMYISVNTDSKDLGESWLHN
jgi:hypothetical protein